MVSLGLILIVVGVVIIGLVGYTWSWCMKCSRIRSVAKVLKEPRARILFVIVGLALICLGYPLAVGWWG
jgi:uncharacterized membrane protein YwzB